MTRLRSMFLAIGLLATAGGATYSLYLLRAEYSPADAVDAGLLQVSTPARLSCRVRIAEECRALPDGGLRPRYGRLGLKARMVPSTNPDSILFDVPDAWRPCIRIVGTPTEACDVVEDGGCTDPTICAANAAPQPEVDQCACSSGSNCTVGGSAAPLGVTLAAGTWAGTGCVRKYCGPEIAGEQGQSWPAGCP